MAGRPVGISVEVIKHGLTERRGLVLYACAALQESFWSLRGSDVYLCSYWGHGVSSQGA